MPRIAGIHIKEDIPISSALTDIYGIGRKTSLQILSSANIAPNTKAKDLDTKAIEKIRSIIDGMKVEGDLRVETMQNIKRLKEIGTYRGIRHTKNLPARGQRTKTNARTKRGKKVTVGSGRKKSAEKT